MEIKNNCARYFDVFHRSSVNALIAKLKLLLRSCLTNKQA